MCNNLNNLAIELTPKGDSTFKYIFGKEGHENILKSFLESYLGIKISSLKIDGNQELLPENFKGKKSIVDVRATLDDGSIINVEMQSNASKYSDKRCLQHWSRIYSNSIKKSEDYSPLPKTICIWILNENVFKEFDDFESKWIITDEKYGIKNHFNELEFHIIECQNSESVIN